MFVRKWQLCVSPLFNLYDAVDSIPDRILVVQIWTSCMLTVLYTPYPEENIPNIIDYHLKKGYPILIIFGKNISNITGHQIII